MAGGTVKRDLLETEDEELISPKRYNQGDLEVWDAILGLGLGYLEGNVVKYICRHQMKNGREDLEKAKIYIDKMIDYYYSDQKER